MNKQNLIKEAFSIIGEELSKIECSPAELNLVISNFRNDGFDITFNSNVTQESLELIYHLSNKIRIDNNIWFDSGFGKTYIEWNFDSSLDKDE